MAQKDRAALNAQADQIKNETVKDANSTARVGQILNDLADSQSNLVDDPQTLTYIEETFSSNDTLDLITLGFDASKPAFVSLIVSYNVGADTAFEIGLTLFKAGDYYAQDYSLISKVSLGSGGEITNPLTSALFQIKVDDGLTVIVALDPGFTEFEYKVYQYK